MDDATWGTYVGTGTSDRPAGATGGFNGLMIHPDLPKILVRGRLQAILSHWHCSYSRGEGKIVAPAIFGCLPRFDKAPGALCVETFPTK